MCPHSPTYLGDLKYIYDSVIRCESLPDFMHQTYATHHMRDESFSQWEYNTFSVGAFALCSKN